MHKDYYKYPNGNYIVFLHKDIPTFVSRVAHSFYGCVIMKISMIQCHR